MTDEQHRVDPRYDPAFQRGYTGQAPPRVLRGSGQPARAVDPPRPDSTWDDDAEDQIDAGPAAAPAAAQSTESDDPGEHAPSMRDLGRNPFLIALVILGAGLTAGGLVWGNHAREAIADVTNEFDYWYLQASVVGAPLTSIAGIAVLAGVLFVAAAAWNRR